MVDPLLVIVALPAVELSENSVKPPLAPLTVLPLLVIVALTALVVSLKCKKPPTAPLTVPPLLVIVELPAVEVSKNSVKAGLNPLTVLPLLVIAELPAVEPLLKNNVPPDPAPMRGALFVNTVMLPAVALLKKEIDPLPPPPLTAVTKFWEIPELLVMPVPLMVSVNVGLAVIVKALPDGLKTMLFTSVLAESETPVIVDRPKVAVSAELLGTVAGVQLAAVFQSPVPGAVSHVALPAKAGPADSMSESAKSVTMIFLEVGLMNFFSLRFVRISERCCVH